MKSLIDRCIAKLGCLLGGSGLRGRMARGGAWLGAGSISENGFRMIRQMILARILLPDDFGTMQLILSINMFFESITQIGMREAVIQNDRGHDKAFLNSTFWFSGGRSLLLYITALILIPSIADFYQEPGQPDLAPMMRFAFVSMVLYGFLSPQSYAELKKMNYRRWVVIFHGGSMIGITTAIVLGFVFQNVWALIVGLVVEQFSRLVLSYIICPFIPTFTYDRESVRSLYIFARGMFGLPILVFMYTRADAFVIGKLCTRESLGLYGLAANLVQVPFNFYQAVINPVLLPAFSPLKNDLPNLSKRIIKSSKMQALIFLPGLTFMACAAPLILYFMYGEKYIAASIPFAILCGSMAVRIIGAVITNALIAIGKPGYTREASIVRVVTIAVLIIPMVVKFGLNGAAIANLVAGVLWLGTSLLRVRSNIKLPVYRFIGSLFMGGTISLCVAVIVLLVRYTLFA